MRGTITFYHFMLQLEYFVTPPQPKSKGHTRLSFFFFVDQFGRLYGSKNVVYCVHSLIHLGEEYVRNNTYHDDFSAFPFETYLGQLNKLPRGTRRPLAQYFQL